MMRNLPFLAGGILQMGTLLQILRMIRERSAKGQSAWGWVGVITGLTLWLIFYMYETPEQTSAIATTLFSTGLCFIALVTVLYFRLEEEE